jgi:hypothetical protein
MQSQLIMIDLVSGLSSIIGSSALQLSSAGFAGGLNGLFEVDSMSNLYAINPGTGVATLVGATGLAPDYQDWTRVFPTVARASTSRRAALEQSTSYTSSIRKLAWRAIWAAPA